MIIATNFWQATEDFDAQASGHPVVLMLSFSEAVV